MKDYAILKVLYEANLIDIHGPQAIDLTCEEECKAKLAIAIAACNLFLILIQKSNVYWLQSLLFIVSKSIQLHSYKSHV